jgi:SAM domain (Sterile alpha motif)
MSKGSEAKAPSGTQDVETFLASVNLQKYTSTFLENGVDDLEIILELDDKHLEQMSVPLGHKLKIMKRIKELRKDRGMAIPDSR